MPLMVGGKKVSSLYAEIGANTTPFEQGAKKVKGELNGMAQDMSGLSAKSVIGWTAIGAAVTAVGTVMKDAMEETLKYDSAVRQLAEVSGTSVEDASRLLQVMDDFKITADDVGTATRKMTKEGLSPTLETLAQMSDQYNKLNPGQERAKFLMDNFGKSGLKFAEAMSKGGDALRQMGMEVEKGLIRTDAQIAKTRLAEFALENYQDKLQEIKVALGSGLIGLLDGSTVAIQKQAQELYKAEQGAYFNTNQMGRMSDAQKDAWASAQKLATEQYLLSHGMDITQESSDGLTLSLEEQAEALKEMNDINKSLLGLVGEIQSAEESYQEKSKSLTEERIKIEGERATAIAQGWWTSSEKVRDYDAALDENTRKVQENEQEHDKANKAIMLGLLERKLTADGILDDNELNFLLNQGVAWGIYSDTVIAEMQQAMFEADKLKASVDAIPDQKTISIILTAGQTADAARYTGQAAMYASSASTGGGNSRTGRASGGPVMAGGIYTVGERGPETFVPTQSGNIVPNAGIDYRKMARAFRDALAQAG